MKEKTIIALLLLVILALAGMFALRLPARLADAALQPVIDGADVLDQAAKIQRQEIVLPTITPEWLHSGCAGGLYFTSNPAKCLGPDGLRVANEAELQPFVRQLVPVTPQP